MTELSYAIDLAKKGNKDQLMLLIDKFTPLIKKYVRLLNYNNEDAYADMVMNFIETIKNSPFSINSENCKILSYISKSVYHSYIALSKKDRLWNISKPISFYQNDDGDVIDLIDNVEDKNIVVNEAFEFVDMFHHLLTNYELDILVSVYIYDYSIKELSVKYHVSSPAITKTKKRAENKLKIFYKKELLQ